MGKREELWALLEPTVEAMGYELIEVELRLSAKRSLLRLYIDGADGVDLSDCEAVSHQASGLLDLEDPLPGAYTLEVSSPGLDRPLVKGSHFRRFIGERVKVRTILPIEGRRNFTGYLVDVRDQEIELEVEDRRWCLALTDVERARLAPEL